MKRKAVLIMAVLFLVLGTVLFAQEAEAAPAREQNSSVWKYFAAAIAVGISCIAGGIAVGQIGSAAMGAMSENPELSGKALPYAGLAEGICLWGFLVALLIMIL
jgi:V/A-type H+-transporting ATPase subunit K